MSEYPAPQSKVHVHAWVCRRVLAAAGDRRECARMLVNEMEVQDRK